MSDDHGIKLTTKYPPYNIESLKEGEAREAVVMETDIVDGTIKTLRFYPVALNGRGDPEYMAEEAALKALRRLQKHCSRLGTEVVIVGTVGIISVK